MIDKRLTYRLIGAGLMVLSAAIVLPLVLDGERPPELDMQVDVSEPPAFEVVKIAPVKSVQEIASEEAEKAPQDIQLIPLAKSVSPQTTQPKHDAKAPVKVVKAEPKKVADRWTVQIATFKSKSNATRLVEKLNKANYDAYSVTTNSLYKVFVGPEFKRDTSKKIRDDIKKEFGLAGLVVKYSVN
ncbi:SPOR domain-containing protein [Marinomonas posidonica]|uniref:Sporulation domain-containing protein n=1 Tax=Marinomonas posidonica (strain CECT 7376 / NCIMB 14433 / IVIA-Po-181) TaxID=491952 RepID=F6CZB0_MARPP|nr:SPOR domain-containing protein [Marinomonas posidonica]AEF54647.1 Sporulation domain-containing protein [Marinomonas posidonica IVIA-Po-181]